MFERVDVAAISFVPEKFDLEQNADRLEEMFRKAAKGGAQLALAPEGVLEGYVVMEIIEGRVQAEAMRAVAVSTRGAMMERFRALARELDMCLAFGLAEKAGKDVYNCAVFIDHTGRLCGKYHKMQLAEGYHSSWWFNRLGKQSRAFSTPFGRCGFLICNDRWNPDIARMPVLDGAQYLLIPSYGSRSKEQDRNVLARGRENGVPIVEANVGVTMAVSKGEVVALSRKETTITFATIEVPAVPSRTNRDEHEGRLLDWRRKEMRKRYQKTKDRSRKKGKK
ncbi:MAG: carbon-nitrogen hydrolase family protein [Candidatus Latescibacterota bacterium]|nr:carbon-nitrogen hydrolase family protein [Candidatus Latescibacterota bacterium]